MGQIVLVGVGAGVAGTLLFLSPIGETVLALPLIALCGLPIAIAGVAWTWLASLIALLVAGAAILLYLSPTAAAAYLLLFGGPAAWTARLVGLWRETPDGERQWYPLGRILLHGAAAVAVGLIVVGVIIGFDPATFTAEMTATLADWLSRSPDVGLPLAPAEIEPLVRFNVAAMPVTVSALLLVILVFTTWLAARVAAMSGRLQRPLVPLWTVDPPLAAAAILIVAALAFFVPGAAGEAAGAFAGAFGAAFSLVGLAVVHAVTLGNNFRIPILVAAYVLIVLFGFPILVFTALGLAEIVFRFRARRSGGAPPLS